ncbi:asparagine synthase (glutamine-hydrolyzing) [Paractinoplanes rishiriensis]|nr:asparagine synthase (glutamine-hydrolyzing) [Actinoplanes rishiriensis]
MVSTDEVDPGLVRRMCAAIEHRGPDGAGYHTGPQVALGMRRLAVIDVAGGQQPVRNEDGTVLAVFNGELYNHPELRADLIRRGHRLTTRSDTECLVHLYEEYGDDLVHRLRGMFAFAIWDAGRARLLLARDRVGKKPLYWRSAGPGLAFASELKALLQDPAWPRRVDHEALHHYLTYQYVPAPWSIYTGVQKLPPGHLLVWQNGIASVRRYWRLDFTPRPAQSAGEACERIRTLLLEATRIRMVSERPLGAFLSGGIDSSAVVAAMARQSTDPVRTFSIGFEERGYDERRYARMVAARYRTDHHEMVVTPSALTVLPTLAWHFDEPFADSSAIPSFYVAQLSRQHVTVVLNGDGGDECFGGYQRYAVMARLSGLPVRALAPLVPARLGPLLTRSLPHKLGRAFALLGQPAARRYGRLMSYFDAEQKLALYSDALRDELEDVDSYRLFDETWAASAADSDVGRAIDTDVNTYLPGDLLPKVDITTMANSLEARSPFLDHHLLEWAAGLPTRMKVTSADTKRILKQAVVDWLPAEVVNRPKMGFGVPMASWLRGALRDHAYDLLTDHTARSRGLFRPDVVSGLLREHESGLDRSRQLWALIQFEQWHRSHVEVPAATTADAWI